MHRPLRAVGKTVGIAMVTLLSCKLGKATTVGDSTKRWDELSFSEKKAHMRDVVEPRMKQVFQEFDSRRFADFGCATCHGPVGEARGFAMPNPDLPHLRRKGFYREARKSHPETTKFMWKTVEKNMGELLGQTYGPKGEIECSSCHVIDDHDG